MEIEKGRAGMVTREQIEKDIEELKSVGGQPPFVLVKHPALYIDVPDALRIRVVDNRNIHKYEYYICPMDGVEDSNEYGPEGQLLPKENKTLARKGRLHR